jgi:hypothetical protein
MRLATVLATICTLLLTIPTAKAQDFCVTGYSVPISLPSPNAKKQVPFTAIVKLTFDQKLADGNAIHGEVRYHIARDASGTVMNESPSGCVLGDDGQMHQIFHVAVRSGKTMEEWTLGDDRMQKIATIIHLPDPVKPSEAELAAMRARAGSRPPPQTNQWQTESLGTREFQDIPARGTRRTQTIPPGQQGNALQLVITNETWLSSQFGNMMAISDDPRRGRSTAEVVEFHQAAPDPSLFSPPKDYIVKEQPAQPPATIIGASATPQ